MSNSTKELCDYDLVKRCSKCGIISSKSIFHKDKFKSDGLKVICIICRKKHFLENRNRVVNNQKLYNKQNRVKINARLKE